MKQLFEVNLGSFFGIKKIIIKQNKNPKEKDNPVVSHGKLSGDEEFNLG